MKKKTKLIRPKKFLQQRAFDSWLNQNINKFSKAPYFYKSTSESAEYRFKGVSTKIRLCMDRRGNFMLIAHDGRWFDILCEFDTYIEKTSTGKYYCSLWIPKYRKYYASKTALLTSHTFKPLIKWVSENLATDKSLIVLGEHGWTLARIIDTSAANRKRKHVIFRGPVIKERKSKLNGTK